MRSRIAKYRRTAPDDRTDFTIGCRILTQPFFLPERDWIPIPDNWSPNIVSFKGYSTADVAGLRLWESVQLAASSSPLSGFSEQQARYGTPSLVRPRLGQGAFRILVTDSYRRRCAFSGEKTLPALDAAHIRPFSNGGQHETSNGILMRRDMHSLFDNGYMTVNTDLRIEVSRRIREEFENGRNYYDLHGKEIARPDDHRNLPDRFALMWHNENVFRG